VSHGWCGRRGQVAGRGESSCAAAIAPCGHRAAARSGLADRLAEVPGASVSSVRFIAFLARCSTGKLQRRPGASRYSQVHCGSRSDISRMTAHPLEFGKIARGISRDV
jgi:hypothetical protein